MKKVIRPPRHFNVPPNETFREKTCRFSLMQAYWRIWVHENFPGHDLNDGDAWRNPKVFGKVGTKKKGSYGRASSLHKSRLAKDNNLYIDGVYQKTSEAHREIGAGWASMSDDASSGVDFNDGNHCSLAHGGRR